MPLISVIIPAYNYANYLPQAIESIKNQSIDNWECLIIDDGSTDNTREVSENYANSDNRIKYHFKQNGGLSSARNHGINLATGKYVIFLDADDYLEKYNLEHLSNFLETKNDDCAVFGKFFKFYDDNTPNYSWYKDYNYKIGRQDDFYQRLLYKNSLPPCAPMCPLNVIKTNNLQFDESLTSYEDWDFWLRLCKKIDFYYQPQENAAAMVRFHSGSMSTDNWRMEINQLKVRLKLKPTITIKNEKNINNNGIESSVKTLLYNIADTLQNNDKQQAETKINQLTKIYNTKKTTIFNSNFLKNNPKIFRRTVWIVWERIKNIIKKK